LQLVKALLKIGIKIDRQKGSHAQLRGVHGGISRFTTIPIHMGEELPNGIVLAVLRDCGITKKELVELLEK
jgi:predicted RNA binding protein YcfA (HicA-like mRNA interferase family)